MSIRSSKGFTLLEILIVLIILGVIAGIAVPAFQGQIEKGRAQEAYRGIAMIKESLVRYFSQRDPQTYVNASLGAGACNNGVRPGQTIDVNPNCTATGVPLFAYTIGNLGAATWTITATRNAGGPCAGNTISLTQAQTTPTGTGCFT